jgi:hypothetical protein
MKRWSLLIIIWCISIAHVSAQKGDAFLKVVNRTGGTIYSLFVSESITDKIGEDVLFDKVLENGKSFDIKLPRTGKWDVMALHKDGSTFIVMSHNVRWVYDTLTLTRKNKLNDQNNHILPPVKEKKRKK